MEELFNFDELSIVYYPQDPHIELGLGDEEVVFYPTDPFDLEVGDIFAPQDPFLPIDLVAGPGVEPPFIDLVAGPGLEPPLFA